jgi:glucose/arabinose dehydrogenase
LHHSITQVGDIVPCMSPDGKVNIMIRNITQITLLATTLFVIGCSSSSDPEQTKPPGGSTAFATQVAFPNLTFTRPVDLQCVGGRVYVVEQAGRILCFHESADTDSMEVFLDITTLVDDSGNEEGLLGLAFAPGYDGVTSNDYFVYYNVVDAGNFTRVSRFTSQNNTTDPSTRVDVISIGQPFENHNGGQIAFRESDGMLYIALGDGGSANDPQDNGQDLSTLLGSILRIDVSSLPYTVPGDNPFSGRNVRKEIWARGLRNPWRFSFDPATDRMFCGDVGQGAFEEVNLITKGGNYGWRIAEGNDCRPGNSGCDLTGLIPPIWQYGRPNPGARRAVTGGYVYTGPIVSLQGAYIYGDYVTGEIWALRVQGTTASNEPVIDASFGVAAFGVGNSGELYICAFQGGNDQIHRIAEESAE